MDKHYDEPVHDEFLHTLRADPRPAFAEELYTRIAYQRRGRMLPRMKLFAPRRMVWATTALCLVVAVVGWASPTARAEVMAALRQIGGLAFDELDAYPQGWADPVDPKMIVPEETLSIADARARLPFAFGLPTWVPDGFVLIDEARVMFFNEQPHNAQFMWRKDDPEDPNIWTTITLLVEPRKGGEGSIVIGRGSAEEVQINGEPAALVRGAWNADTHQWETNDITPQTELSGIGNMINLHWVANDVGYHLSGVKDSVSEEDLIRLADSIR